MTIGNVRNSRRGEGVATVVIIVGGTFQVVAECPEVASADVVQYVDVQAEVESLNLGKDVVSVRLASGETLATLTMESGSEALRAFLSDRPGINMQTGCAQLPTIGYAAVRKLVNSPGFRNSLVSNVFEKLLIRHNGCLLHVNLYVCASEAGGTGSPGARALAEVTSQMIRDLSNATVQVCLQRVGSLTFSQLGDRVHPNTGAALAEDLDYVVCPDRDSREMRALELVELPMVGPQKELRDAAVMAYVQATCCRDVRTLLDRTSPNDALNSALGSVRVVRASYGQALVDRHIAAEVAKSFEAEIESVVGVAPSPGVGDDFVVRTREEPTPNLATVEEIGAQVRGARGVRGATLWERCVQVPVSITNEGVYTNVRDQERAPLRTRILTDCRSVREWRDKVGTLRSLIFGLQRELQERAEPLRSARKAVTEATAKVRSLFDKLFPSRWWQCILVALSDAVTTVLHLQNAITEFREASRECAKLECEYVAVSDALLFVEAEARAEDTRLEQTLELLRSVGTRTISDPLVHPSSIDPILVELVREAGHQNSEVSQRVYRLLASCVSQVTMSGLGAILGTIEVRAANIAYHLTREQLPIRGPAWGGKRHLGPMQRIMVLPPMSGEDRDHIRRLVNQEDPNLIVAMADTARGSVNVVLLEMFSPRYVDEVFTLFHQQYCRRALEQPHLFFTRDVDTRRWLDVDPSSNGRRSTSCEQ